MNAAFRQGFRCGHIEGRATETALSPSQLHAQASEAAAEQTNLDYFQLQDWAAGYRYGFTEGLNCRPIPEGFDR